MTTYVCMHVLFRFERGRAVRVRVGVRNIINPISFVAVMILFRFRTMMIQGVPRQFHVLVLRMILEVEGLGLVLGKM